MKPPRNENEAQSGTTTPATMSSFGEASEIDCHQPIGDFVVVIQLGD